MVDILPFRALRPSFGEKHADVSDFICPPYDVIAPTERLELINKSSSNVVQLELPEGEGDSKYERAKQILQEWKNQEIVQHDRRASFYVLETTYKIQDPFAPKSLQKRYGVMVALQLETPGKGAIKPHEKTLPKAKEDRLKLLASVQTNISPIFGLFFDSKDEFPKWLARVVRDEPLSTGKEKQNLDHRMWKIDDPGIIQQLQSLLKGKDLFIADGHHRYEVSWAYKDSRLKENPAAGLTEGWQNVMAYLCPMEEPGLLMLPTHRLVKSKRTLDEWDAHLKMVFDLEPVAKLEDVITSLSRSHGKERIMGYVTAKGFFIVKLRDDISIDLCLAHRPEALRALDVVLLHDIALGEGPGIQFLPEKELEFTRDIEAMKQRTQADPQTVGFLLGSPGVESLAKVASAGEVMPPKTTYFYPKVPTGFTLMPLDQKIE
jgi:uncharacterized protein (DUF1015 family)